jgi:hypothetical protein
MKDYPDYKWGGDEHIQYFVEFDRGVDKGTFTIFRRNLMPKEYFDPKNCPENVDNILFQMGREVHPYQLFDGHCRDGAFPSPEWVIWMVDALNEKLANDIKNRQDSNQLI